MNIKVNNKYNEICNIFYPAFLYQSVLNQVLKKEFHFLLVCSASKSEEGKELRRGEEDLRVKEGLF